MAWPEEITDGLPAPRDDEPESLRQDILDELSDHLYGALDRELHRGNDETNARHNVLDRFGNPARIAYRLWFDAMKEKIVSQRITLATAIVVSVACLFVAGMAWQVSQQSRETNVAILDNLRTLAAQQEQHKSLDWNPLKFSLVTGSESGPPAEGFKVTLDSSSTGSFGGMPQLERTSGSDGQIDFGLVRYGKYSINVATPWEEYGYMTITVQPGHPYSKTIVCPVKPEPADIAITVDWPDELKQAKLWAYVNLAYEAVPGLETNALPDFGGFASDTDVQWGFSFNSKIPSSTALITETGAFINLGSGDIYVNETLQNQIAKLNPETELHSVARRVKLTSLKVLSEPQLSPDGKTLLPHQPLCSYYFRQRAQGGFGPRTRDGLVWPGLTSDGSANTFVQSTALESPSFEPKPNQLNTWEVKLPDNLVEGIRRRLATPKS